MVEVVMRGFNHQIGLPTMALGTENVDFVAAFKQRMSQLGTKCRQSLCTVLHGGHELYRARTDTKIYQQCLLCGYETSGWTIDRRDRQLHLVKSRPSAASGRR